jgi:hypothetical protein
MRFTAPFDIADLRALGRRLAAPSPADDLATRLVAETLEHLTTGSDGLATAVELDLIAWTFEAQGALLTRPS